MEVCLIFFQHPHSIYLFRSEKIDRLLFVFRKESANMKKKTRLGIMRSIGKKYLLMSLTMFFFYSF